VSYGLDSAGRVNSISGLMTGQSTSYASNVLYMPWDAIQQASFGSLGLGEARMYNKRMQPLEVNRGISEGISGTGYETPTPQ